MRHQMLAPAILPAPPASARASPSPRARHAVLRLLLRCITHNQMYVLQTVRMIDTYLSGLLLPDEPRSHAHRLAILFQAQALDVRVDRHSLGLGCRLHLFDL